MEGNDTSNSIMVAAVSNPPWIPTIYPVMIFPSTHPASNTWCGMVRYEMETAESGYGRWST